MRLFASEKTWNLKTLNCFQTIFRQYMEDYLLFWEVYLHSHTWFRQIFVPHWTSPVLQTLFLLSSLLNKFLIDNLLRTLIHFSKLYESPLPSSNFHFCLMIAELIASSFTFHDDCFIPRPELLTQHNFTDRFLITQFTLIPSPIYLL